MEFSGYGGRWWCTYKLDAMRIQKTRHIEQVGDFSHVFYPLPTPKETSAAAAEQMFGIGGTYNILQSSIDILYTVHCTDDDDCGGMSMRCTSFSVNEKEKEPGNSRICR